MTIRKIILTAPFFLLPLKPLETVVDAAVP
jgi:hypothetical protein